jgi:endonuclease/exonuclease/phosphatase family metal-dependent hydrolase
VRLRLFGVGLSLVTAAATTRATHAALANFNLHHSSSSHHRSPQSFFLLSPKQARGKKRRKKQHQGRDHGNGGWPSGMEQQATLAACSNGESGGGSNDEELPSNDILSAAGEDLLDEYCEVMDDFGCSAFEKFSEGQRRADGRADDFQWIRLENRVDSCLAEISSKEDVVRRIQEVKLLQGKSGRTDLYSRPWQYRNAQAGKKDEDESSLQEPVNGASPATYPRGSFSVMQFNMLAEGLSAGPTAQIPFLQNNNPGNQEYSQSEKQSYGGFTDIPQPNVSMDFNLRRWRLLEVILGSDGCSAPFDLIGLEEIDRYRGFFAPIMRVFGYQGIFAPKTRSPCVRMGWYSDGCAIFWKSQLFELLSERRVEYKVGSQIGIVATLRHRPTDRPLVVAVTHLKAQQSAANENTRAAQVDELLRLVTDEAATVALKERSSDKHIPILILGDFNADPPSQIEGSGNDVSSVKQVVTFHEETDQGKKTRQQFQSAYPLDPPNDDFYTTWKIRGPKTSKRIIDYIFYSTVSLECRATLKVPCEEELEPSKLPGLRYPSDHMAIAAIVKLLLEDE